MIQVKEMMQDKDLKNTKSKDEGSKSRSQSMNDQSYYKQAKTKTNDETRQPPTRILSVIQEDYLLRSIRHDDEDDEDEDGIEPVIPPSSTDTTTTRARITVWLQASIPLPPEAEVERLLAMPTPPPSPLTSLSPPSAGSAWLASTQALIDAVTAALPSPPLPPLPPLPPPLYIPPPVDRMDDIPETELPPHKKSCLFALGPRYEVMESSTARLTGEVGYGIKDTWVDPVEAVLEILHMTLEERVDLLIEDRIAHQETILIVKEEACAAREAWAHSIGLSQAVHSELQTHRDQVYVYEFQLQAHQTQQQLQEILRVMGDMRREMGDTQAELLALREQPRRARQPRSNARVPDHQDAFRDADSHISSGNTNVANAQRDNRVYAVRNAEKKENASRDPNSNVVTGTFLLNNRYASILFDTGADGSFISTAFSSLIDIVPTPLGIVMMSN
nr:putative reverse transcriptase domain-containing protein [Tanacetum cinerariifolium]